MIIKKKAANDILIEVAHGGSGARKVLVDKKNSSSEFLEMMTHGYLPAGATFDWHHHDNTEEIMLVLRGKGAVSDKEGTYEYAPGDVYVFPAKIEHMIHNPTSDEHEMIFLRIKV